MHRGPLGLISQVGPKLRIPHPLRGFLHLKQPLSDGHSIPGSGWSPATLELCHWRRMTRGDHILPFSVPSCCMMLLPRLRWSHEFSTAPNRARARRSVRSTVGPHPFRLVTLATSWACSSLGQHWQGQGRAAGAAVPSVATHKRPVTLRWPHHCALLAVPNSPAGKGEP